MIKRVDELLGRHGVVPADTDGIAQVLAVLGLEEVLLGDFVGGVHPIPFVPALIRVFPVFELVVSVLPPLLLLHVLLHIGDAATPLEQGIEVKDVGLCCLCIHLECYGAYQRHDGYDSFHDFIYLELMNDYTLLL